MKIAEIIAHKEGYFTPKTPIVGTLGEKARTITDDTGTIALKDWTDTLSSESGKQVILEGMGIKRASYKGTDQLSISEKTQITLSEPAGGSTAPSPSTSQQNAVQTPSNASQSVIHGMTVGMALNNATKLYTSLVQAGKEMPKDWINSGKFKIDLWIAASGIIDVSQAMEKGQLAPRNDFEGVELPWEDEKGEEL